MARSKAANMNKLSKTEMFLSSADNVCSHTGNSTGNRVGLIVDFKSFLYQYGFLALKSNFEIGTSTHKFIYIYIYTVYI